MKKEKQLTPEELKDRAIRFHSRYGKELEQVAELLEIKLKQLALAYTINEKLPPEAVKITTRVKTLKSFLKKLEADGWPQFYYPTDVIKDFIGARMVCWFVDDVYGMLESIKSSSHFTVANEKLFPLKDFIKNPQPAGYRALHIFADIEYDGVKKINDKVVVTPNKILCEIQVRSKLQDAWGDITHEFFYKAKNHDVQDDTLESFLADISARLAIEDKTLMKLRDTYQQLTDEKIAEGTREGFQDEA